MIVKHANPCGVASSNSLKEAYEAAFKTDPTSAFGGIIAFNKNLDEETASLIINQFAEVIIATDFTEGALKVFRKKKKRGTPPPPPPTMIGLNGR